MRPAVNVKRDYAFPQNPLRSSVPCWRNADIECALRETSTSDKQRADRSGDFLAGVANGKVVIAVAS